MASKKFTAVEELRNTLCLLLQAQYELEQRIIELEKALFKKMKK